MICPRCKNAGFVPSTDFKKPLINLGAKEHFSTFNIRRYTCVQCAYVFKTKEEFYMEVKVRSNQTDLLESVDGNK